MLKHLKDQSFYSNMNLFKLHQYQPCSFEKGLFYSTGYSTFNCSKKTVSQIAVFTSCVTM